jgi:glycosyltransferase involved in cell wall biosynthesis
MPSRHWVFAKLYHSLLLQYTDEMEILTDNGMDCNIGAKRNRMLQSAKGEYVVFVDDDDLVTPDYVSKIFSGMGADCIGISGIMTVDGRDMKQWHISKQYGSWREENGVYLRTPNHISPVRREIALRVGFPEIEHGEDYAYSMGILPLLKTENIVKGNIYHYKYVNK